MIPTFDLETAIAKEGYRYIVGTDEAGRGCERPDAEVLTNTGWKHHLDIDADKDLVLSYTPTGEIVWQKIDYLFEKEYGGKLIELKNRSVHIVVTPDHAFDVLRRTFKRDKDNSNKLKMTGYTFRGRKNVEELNDNDVIPRGGQWFDKTYNTLFTLPGLNKNKWDHSGKDLGDKFIPMEVWTAFMGIYLAEGSYKYEEGYGYNVIISQNKTSSCYEELKALLEELPFEFKECAVGFITYSKQLAYHMKQFGHVYDKFIPDYIKSLSPSLLNNFIRWAIKGDGSCYQSANRKEVCMYYTVSNKLRDDFEEILLKAGWTYKTTLRPLKDTYIRGRLVKKENKVPCFEIRLRRNNKIVCKHLHRKELNYSGKVFCLSLPKYHNFYVRRSGSGYFTGNSLAGPVVAAAVSIPEGNEDHLLGIVNDSKKMTAKRREEAYELVTKYCNYGIQEIGPEIIDDINILEATKLAMKSAVEQLEYFDYVMIDGTVDLSKHIFCEKKNVIRGDSLSLSIAAASVIAKVTRDRIMESLHSIFPVYGFDTHKGYGTKKHIEAIKTYGPCKFHRLTFNKVKDFI